VYLKQHLIQEAAYLEHNANNTTKPQHAEDLRRAALELREQAAAAPEGPSASIPFIAVGFEGWKSDDSFRDRLSSGLVDAIFVLRHAVYHGFSCVGHDSTAYLFFLEHLSALLQQAANRVSSTYQYAFMARIKRFHPLFSDKNTDEE
jgi:hypothetical protein